MSVHTITVTQIINDHLDVPDDEFTGEVKFTIDHCPGGDCTVWFECTKDECKDRDHEQCDEGDNEYTAHGEEHQCIDGKWMTESTGCAAVITDSGSDATQDVCQEAGIGTHQIDVSYWGDGTWEASLIKPQETP